MMLLVLSLALVLNGITFKQQFNELINGISQTNRNQKSNLLFYNDMVNIEEFNSRLQKIDKKSYNDMIILVGSLIIQGW